MWLGRGEAVAEVLRWMGGVQMRRTRQGAAHVPHVLRSCGVDRPLRPGGDHGQQPLVRVVPACRPHRGLSPVRHARDVFVDRGRLVAAGLRPDRRRDDVVEGKARAGHRGGERVRVPDRVPAASISSPPRRAGVGTRSSGPAAPPAWSSGPPMRPSPPTRARFRHLGPSQARPAPRQGLAPATGQTQAASQPGREGGLPRLTVRQGECRASVK